jgi:hypothetical protein
MPRLKKDVAPAADRRHESQRASMKLPTPVRADPVADALRSLSPQSGIASIRDAWQRRLGESSPAIQSADLLLRLLAWRLQVETYGGLDEITARQLSLMATALTNDTDTSVPAVASLETGTILIREWRNTEHRVLVQDGGFEYQGKRYQSLTVIARAITGTNWSGPRFFGLAPRVAARGDGPLVSDDADDMA